MEIATEEQTWLKILHKVRGERGGIQKRDKFILPVVFYLRFFMLEY